MEGGKLAVVFDWTKDSWTPIHPFNSDTGDFRKNPSALLLGGKGAGLHKLCAEKIPVPPGFVIDTEVCKRFQKMPSQTIKFLTFRVASEYKRLAEHLGYAPLVSVRSGAPVSMPGMMDTITNVGLTPDNLSFWTGKLGVRTALDCYRRLISEYSHVVYGIDSELISKTSEGLDLSDAEDLAMACNRLRTLYAGCVGEEFPSDFMDQVMGAIRAVFNSWDNPRAREYRAHHGIPEVMGTAVTIQMMVFGNLGEDSGTGVLFTRSPSTGECVMTGEYLPNAQGEEVVTGSVTPKPLKEMPTNLYDDLDALAKKIESMYHDMVDVEFTIERGKIWILQSRAGKRTARAAFQIAHDLMVSKVIGEDEALRRVTPEMYRRMSGNQFDPSFTADPDGIGIGASPGIVFGVTATTAEAAIAMKQDGQQPILVRPETNPDDFSGMVASVGILTATGGMTSHAAVVARSLNKPAVTAVNSVRGTENWFPFVKNGIPVLLDGATGRVWFGPAVAEAKIVEGSGTDFPALRNMVAIGYKRMGAIPISPRVIAPEQRIPFYMLALDETIAKETLSELRSIKWEHRHKIVMDIASPDAVIRPEDVALWNVFGVEDKSGVDLDIASSAEKLLLTKSIPGITVAFGAGFDPNFKKKFLQHGYVVGGTVASLRDLLSLTGPCEVDPGFIKQIGEWEYQQLCELIGNKMEPLPKGMSQDEIVMRCFGGDHAADHHS